MSDLTLTKTRLVGGVWEGLLSAARARDAAPALRIRHQDELVGEAETHEDSDAVGARWVVRFTVPSHRISDGVQTFVIEESETGEALAHETLVAGEPLEDDMQAEVALLRAELDMLKKAFRRHCVETMGND